MDSRMFGEIPTFETRAGAHEQVDKKRRYAQIIECLYEAKMWGLSGLTAKEIAVLMNRKGYVPTSERNFVSPRLTEMCESGIVEQIGKTTCYYTGKKVTVFALRGA